mmetsp:Transcript_14182/g.47666  ORF Transcript_14182/g.47666 Transcript_14182/m.47666 type:complete len:210 (-) Transcript_14182:18-647(-)
MRAEVDAAHVAPAAHRAEGEEGADDAAERHVLVDLAQPQRGRLLGEDAVRKGDQREAARLEHAVHLGEELARPGEVGDARRVGDHVELAVGVRQRRVLVQVADCDLRRRAVRRELLRVEPVDGDARADRQRRVVACPRRRRVEEGERRAGGHRAEVGGVRLRQACRRSGVDMRRKAGRGVLDRVVRLVLAREVAGDVRPRARPLPPSQA